MTPIGTTGADAFSLAAGGGAAAAEAVKLGGVEAPRIVPCIAGDSGC